MVHIPVWFSKLLNFCKQHFCLWVHLYVHFLNIYILLCLTGPSNFVLKTDNIQKCDYFLWVPRLGRCGCSGQLV